MDDPLTSAEMETLWRLAGQPWHTHAAQPDAKFEKLRPRIHAAMVEMVLRQLEQQTEAVAPGAGDLLILLTSPDSRLRMLGLRLSTGPQSPTRTKGGVPPVLAVSVDQETWQR